MPKAKPVDTKKVAEAIRGLTADTSFVVCFNKRSDGEERQMACREIHDEDELAKVTKGKGAAYNAADNGLMTVWDVEKDGWRTVPLDGINWLVIDGKKYVVENSALKEVPLKKK